MYHEVEASGEIDKGEQKDDTKVASTKIKIGAEINIAGMVKAAIEYTVKRTKKPVALEPMNPYERRVIHSALQNDKFVCTKSEGEEPYRKVVIMLKKDNK